MERVKMKQDELIKAVKERFEFVSLPEAREFMDAYAELIMQSAVEHGAVPIFGGQLTHELKEATPEREGMKPGSETGEIITFKAKPASNKFAFKAGKASKEFGL